MKNVLLVLIFSLFVFTPPIFSQIKVSTANNVTIGSTLETTFNLEVHGEAKFRCNTNNGIYFKEYAINHPIIQPQWNNNMYLGISTKRLYKIYTQYLVVDGVYITSDRAIKENIRPMSGALDALCSLPVVVFDFKAEIYEDSLNAMRDELIANRKDHDGFIAQDVQEVFPKLVKYDEDAGLNEINYLGFIPQLAKAIQEQQQLIEQQSTELELLKVQLNKLLQPVKEEEVADPITDDSREIL